MNPIEVAAAQLPPHDDSEDKVFTTRTAVIVLDGASAFAPVPISPATYAHTLGGTVRDHLDRDPGVDLADALADAITDTTARLGLSAGASPSSTVTVLRRRGDHVDVLVLGDNLVVLPGRTITDPRLGNLDLPERGRYRRRLADGGGFDDTHRALLIALQRRQATYRNRAGGYWIAETDPAAAYHALRATIPIDQIPWAVLATDGAYTPMRHLDIADWAAISALPEPELRDILARCQSWERDVDPGARALVRAKRHDDKTLVTARFL
ncbi:hypothetical protein ACIQUM_07290 [Amycolatopsis azurea]|uniref:hypothetical protein n=1 Tax=Amycolatopsis azurea TaxID=36819 RepID=UPI00382D962A